MTREIGESEINQVGNQSEILVKADVSAMQTILCKSSLDVIS